MKRCICLTAAVFLLGLPLAAQKKADAAEQAEMVKMIEEAASSLTTMRCNFLQTKKLGLLNDEMVSSGVMYYSQPAKLCWQYLEPYSYTFVINGSKVMMKTDDRKNVVDARQSKMFKEVTQIMVNSVTGKCLLADKDFKVELYVADNEWTAHLTPLRKELKSMFKVIVLHIDPKRCLVTQVDLLEEGEDETNIVLSDYEINTAIDAQKFTVD